MTTDFSPTTLPYGAFVAADGSRHLAVAVGQDLIDLHRAAEQGGISSVDPVTLTTGSLNEHLAAGRNDWSSLRSELSDGLAAGRFDRFIQSRRGVQLVLAWDVADYVDFYASEHHASNVGRMFRPDSEPLLPNWRSLPVGYHGRSGTVVVDGTPIRRPSGQRKGADGEVTFGPSRRLDIELEIGFVVGGSTALGEPVDIADAGRHLFGVVLLNDWSARDIQAWEYVPLGPFLGKSFATSVSGWVVPMDTLAEARAPAPPQSNPDPFPYLQGRENWSLSLDLEVWYRPAGAADASRVAAVNSAGALYWTPAQMLAHMTSNGATIRPGDLFGSGTVSGSEASERGSMLELSWSGRDEIPIGDVTRTFLEDGDEVTLRATAPGPDGPLELGPVSGIVLPATTKERP